MTFSWLTLERRMWLYGIATVLVPLLAYLGADEITLNLSLAVVAAVLGTGTATVASASQVRYGRHAK